jgi:hypothetical protein
MSMDSFPFIPDLADYVGQVCVFCHKHRSRCQPGKTCLYVDWHEFPAGQEIKKAEQPKPKVDKQICLVCKVHRKNPASATNGCQHQYPE